MNYFNAGPCHKPVKCLTVLWISLLLDRIMNRFNSIHTFINCFVKIHCNIAILISHLHVGPSTDLSAHEVLQLFLSVRTSCFQGMWYFITIIRLLCSVSFSIILLLLLQCVRIFSFITSFFVLFFLSQGPGTTPAYKNA